MVCGFLFATGISVDSMLTLGVNMAHKLHTRLMLCSHLTSAFVSMSTSLSKFNIASIVMQMQRMGLNHPLHQHLLLFDGDANADVGCEPQTKGLASNISPLPGVNGCHVDLFTRPSQCSRFSRLIIDRENETASVSLPNTATETRRVPIVELSAVFPKL